MRSVNKVILIGRLGRDPEIVEWGANRIACRLSVATDRKWKARSTGSTNIVTHWHRVVVFDQNSARFAREFLRKGARVYVEGKLRTSRWQDSSGETRQTTEVSVSSPADRLLGLSKPRNDADVQLAQQPLQADDILWSSRGLYRPVEAPF